MVSPISPESRRADILTLLDREGECSIDAMSQRFGVSGMTIRRDLQELADEGRIIRTHGGATAAQRISFEFRFLERSQQNAKEKEHIAELACAMVRPSDSVLLDSSTTTLAIARRLAAIGNLTVVTTSLPIASALFGRAGVEVVILGGVLRKDSPDLTGILTDNNLDMVRTDIAFIGTDAIDDTGHIYNSSNELGQLLRRMARSADRVYAVADHSKTQKHELMCFAHLRDWGGLITDTGLDQAVADKLRENGVKIIQSTKDAIMEPIA